MITTLPSRIVFFGVSGSGKSTLGAMLYEHYGFETIAFADPIKQACKLIFGFDDEHLYGASEKREVQYGFFPFSGRCPRCMIVCERCDLGDNLARAWTCPRCDGVYPKFITPRLACQTLGTEWGRALCTDIWAKSCFASMNGVRSYAVTDGRFHNELQVAQACGAYTVLLLRGLSDSKSTHPSETEVRLMAKDPSLFDFVLDNTQGEARENFDKLIADAKAHADRPKRSLKLGVFEPIRQDA